MGGETADVGRHDGQPIDQGFQDSGSGRFPAGGMREDVGCRQDRGVLLSAEIAEELDAFLADLCTPSELRAFTERWAVARLLDAGGKSYREIAVEADASPTTVVRVVRGAAGSSAQARGARKGRQRP